VSIPDPEQYAQMLDAAAEAGYAYPAVSVSSSETLNAALRGFAEAECDGSVELTMGGAAHVSGAAVGRGESGARAPAAFAREVACGDGVLVALQTATAHRISSTRSLGRFSQSHSGDASLARRPGRPSQSAPSLPRVRLAAAKRSERIAGPFPAAPVSA
jgi:fructose/tagatose bisphosphate aldolase